MYKGCVKIIVVFLCIFMAGPYCPCAASQKSNEIISFLENRFPPIYEPVGKITEIKGGRLVFRLEEQKDRPSRGTEFLVTTYSSETPVYLQPLSSVIKVISFFDENILCTRVITIGAPPKIGDVVVIPPSPTVYLYTNINQKDTFSPYSELLNGILEKDFEVVEINGVEIEEEPSRFGVLVLLEGGNGYLTYKVKSLYSQDTFYTYTEDFNQGIAVSRPLGTRVTLAYAEKPGEKILDTSISPNAGPSHVVSSLPRSRAAVKPKEVVETPFKAKEIRESPDNGMIFLDEAYYRFVFADMDGDSKPSLYFLNNNGIFKFRRDQKKLHRTDQYLFHSPDITGIHLHKGDMNGDGGDELLVTLVEKTVFMGKEDSRLCSMVLTRKDGRLSVVQDNLDYYLRVIQNRDGEDVFIGQTKVGYDQYDGPIFEVAYEGNSIRRGPEYHPASNIYSIYQFNFDVQNKDQVIIIEPSSYVYGYFAPEERVDAMSSKKYGDYRETGYPQKLKQEKYIKGFSDKINSEYVYTARRFLLKKEFDGQCFLISKKRQGGLTAENVLNQVLSRDEKLDTLVGISWLGDTIVETWESKGVARDIIDFCFHGSKVYALTRDNHGNFALEVLR